MAADGDGGKGGGGGVSRGLNQIRIRVKQGVDSPSRHDTSELEVGGLADEFPANFFVLFLFWRETQNSKSEKNKEKQADHGLTVRLPVAIKKGGNYGP
jgi:hypothetical protein